MYGLIAGASAALLLGTSALLHRKALNRERERLSPPGKMVRVNGRRMHVYGEGERGNRPALVFLSGGGTGAPVYDFAPLYRQLSNTHRTVVPERGGYGYSEPSSAPRSVALVLEETREALRKAGELPPYVLFPHSMSGLEALCWARRYPQEILGIVGLDMAVPEYYRRTRPPMALLQAVGSLGCLGIQRLPLVEKCSPDLLDSGQKKQAKYLVIRNFFTPDMIAEGKALEANAAEAARGGPPEQPFLLFCSNGRETGKCFGSCQKAFVKAAGGRLIPLDCGHYVHRFQPGRIARGCRAFLECLEPH